ncbi:DUF4829 domain-containing protein [Anaerobacillus sp. CMMVII]|uniref:DUF4829 domain-containing protein n=1 Tax=Anaerobacillus sp. CMMVII TaxID=2755588 RepID=UPI0021B6EC0D|nr:DUF4829 domain-containing protein [Anaerobacillus sp. CMMVII]MCT8138438.1 DUF4829 domain-containing protein [Anaerobacillus sp. CMMVII]
MKRIVLCLSVLVMMGMLIGCSKSSEAQVDLSPKETIIQFFEYQNEKKLEEMEGLLSEDRKGISWELNKLRSIEILSIEEESSPEMKEQYIKYGRGKDIKESNISVFKVEFEVDYAGGFGSGLDNGVHSWWYYLTRETDTAPWKIDDWGY